MGAPSGARIDRTGSKCPPKKSFPPPRRIVRPCSGGTGRTAILNHHSAGAAQPLLSSFVQRRPPVWIAASFGNRYAAVRVSLTRVLSASSGASVEDRRWPPTVLVVELRWRRAPGSAPTAEPPYLAPAWRDIRCCGPAQAGRSPVSAWPCRVPTDGILPRCAFWRSSRCCSPAVWSEWPTSPLGLVSPRNHPERPESILPECKAVPAHQSRRRIRRRAHRRERPIEPEYDAGV